jgi:hypothetical protein
VSNPDHDPVTVKDARSISSRLILHERGSGASRRAIVRCSSIATR